MRRYAAFANGGAAVQKMVEPMGFTRIKRVAPIDAMTHGGRAKCLQRLIRLDMPVPPTVALSFDAVERVSSGHMPDLKGLLSVLGDGPLVSVRPSSQDPDWGGPQAMLNVGMNFERHADLCETHGREVADQLYLQFVRSYSLSVARLDEDAFEYSGSDARATLSAMLASYEAEIEEPFPQDPVTQLAAVLRSMARAWSGTTARLLRQGRGAPADAGLGLVVQSMALGRGPGTSGQGVIRFVDMDSGMPAVRGRYMPQSLGFPAQVAADADNGLTSGPGNLKASEPAIYEELNRLGALARVKLREEMQIEFTLENGQLSILDAIRVQRSNRASLRIATSLARDGVISKADAILRIEPRSLSELLHPQVDPKGARDTVLEGLAASPGAAVGRVVFSAEAAQQSAARGEACVLVTRETTPEDIRGMHATSAVLTQRGGMSSHAAVIARGLGLPCIVGATEMKISKKRDSFETPDGRVFCAGEVITIDGTTGTVLAGAAQMMELEQEDSVQTLLGWADEYRDIGVRANVDSRAEAQVARAFGAEGIGLCRTEHMFFEEDRLVVMRELIFADESADRLAALERLLPMQRADFIELFEAMPGLPVCIRLLDPPLHEFLPTDRAGVQELAEALNLPVSDVSRRIADLSEVNPMLGMRGVRLGITVPEIYEMQARAIFEAAVDVANRGAPVVPEVMIPLVSARKEVELVRASVDAVASAVQAETGCDFEYTLGVMVETPRAALRAGPIATYASFLSFGTNDLTQMTYGLSRDDAGRFMNQYVRRGVFREDPFHILDIDGVGELLLLGAERARASNPKVRLSICGEHGGNPESIEFCRNAGFDYVSCSPFRVPVAKLAAAQFALKQPVSK